jgi:adenosylcobinamide kinase/adenosylcobinamide-phosphate guanylyltransferase
MSGTIVLVTGGARSGKSRFAEQIAANLGDRVAYVATAAIGDAEMAARVARHRARRPASWQTIDAPYDLLQSLAGLDRSIDVVLVDCLTIWAANRLLRLGDAGDANWWAAVDDLTPALSEELDALLGLARRATWRLLLVTNEVGAGVVPPTPLGRAFRDLLGILTQRVAAEADAVFLVVAGLGMEIKAHAVSPEAWAGERRGDTKKG